MSTNYNILLKSEKKLKELILNYLFLVHEIHKKLWIDTEKYAKENIDLVIDNVERRLKRNKVMEDELLDECIWTISKDDPRANHLRFIISVIYSTKDLSRSCEYTQSIAKIIVRNNLDPKKIKGLKELADLYLEHIENIVKLYKSTSSNKLDKFDEINSKFEIDFEKLQKNNRKQYSEDEIIQYQIQQIGRLIFSTIERLHSIFASVLFSKSDTTVIDLTKMKK